MSVFSIELSNTCFILIKYIERTLTNSMTADFNIIYYWLVTYRTKHIAWPFLQKRQIILSKYWFKMSSSSPVSQTLSKKPRCYTEQPIPNFWNRFVRILSICHRKCLISLSVCSILNYMYAERLLEHFRYLRDRSTISGAKTIRHSRNGILEHFWDTV